MVDAYLALKKKERIYSNFSIDPQWARKFIIIRHRLQIFSITENNFLKLAEYYSTSVTNHIVPNELYSQ